MSAPSPSSTHLGTVRLRLALLQPPPRRASWEHPPLLGLDKKEPSPSPRASYCSPRRSRSLSPRKPQQPCTEVLHLPPSSPPHGPLSPSLPILAFPHGENPLASLYLPVQLISIFMASRALAACARVLHTAIHGDRRHGSTLRPSFWPSLDPPLPRFFPVPSDMHSVARGAITEPAGELSPPSMEFAAGVTVLAGSPLSSLPRFRFQPSIFRLAVEIRRYLFGGQIAQEPLGFHLIEPAVQCVVP